MSKGLVSFSEDRRTAVAVRRIMADTKGLGYWAALNYHDKKGMKYPAGSKAGVAQVVKEIHDNATTDERGYRQADKGARNIGHPGGDRDNKAGGGKPKRRGYKLTLGNIRRGKTNGVGMPAMRNTVSPVDGSARPHATMQGGGYRQRNGVAPTGFRSNVPGGNAYSGTNQNRRSRPQGPTGTRLASVWPKSS